MNKFEKMIYKDSEYMQRCKDYTEFCKWKKILIKELITIFKIEEILLWLDNLLRKLNYE